MMRKTASQINEILWNMLTGNVPYKEIFVIAMSLRLISKTLPFNPLFWIRKKSGIFSKVK